MCLCVQTGMQQYKRTRSNPNEILHTSIDNTETGWKGELIYLYYLGVYEAKFDVAIFYHTSAKQV